MQVGATTVANELNVGHLQVLSYPLLKLASSIRLNKCSKLPCSLQHTSHLHTYHPPTSAPRLHHSLLSEALLSLFQASSVNTLPKASPTPQGACSSVSHLSPFFSRCLSAGNSAELVNMLMSLSSV